MYIYKKKSTKLERKSCRASRSRKGVGTGAEISAEGERETVPSEPQ